MYEAYALDEDKERNFIQIAWNYLLLVLGCNLKKEMLLQYS